MFHDAAPYPFPPPRETAPPKAGGVLHAIRVRIWSSGGSGNPVEERVRHRHRGRGVPGDFIQRSTIVPLPNDYFSIFYPPSPSPTIVFRDFTPPPSPTIIFRDFGLNKRGLSGGGGSEVLLKKRYFTTRLKGDVFQSRGGCHKTPDTSIMVPLRCVLPLDPALTAPSQGAWSGQRNSIPFAESLS